MGIGIVNIGNVLNLLGPTLHLGGSNHLRVPEHIRLRPYPIFMYNEEVVVQDIYLQGRPPRPASILLRGAIWRLQLETRVRNRRCKLHTLDASRKHTTPITNFAFNIINYDLHQGFTNASVSMF